MIELFTQMILASRDRETEPEGIMRFLVWFIVLAFWIVGGILKAKANKAKQGGEEGAKPHLQPAKPVGMPQKGKPPARGVPGRQAYRQAQPPKRAVERPIRIRPKIEAKAEEVMGVDIPSVSAPTPMTKFDLDISQPGGPVAEPAAALYPLGLDDTEQLKAAILHYEILGKPLSMRDPSANLFGY